MTEASSSTRTLKAYAADLLQYPRWVIERDVDFTGCRHGAHYNEFLSECTECQFGPACRWLDQHRTPKTDDASLDELVEAIESAAEYLQLKIRHRGANDAESLKWIREARRFLGSRRA
jgi:hypothetical protein